MKDEQQLQIERTRKHLLEIGKTDPIIHAHLTLWHQGVMTWEQCLMSCIIELHGAYQRLEETALVEIQNRGPDIAALMGDGE